MGGREAVHEPFEGVAGNAQLSAEPDDREAFLAAGRQVLPGLLICHRPADAQKSGGLDDRQKGSPRTMSPTCRVEERLRGEP